MSDDLYSVAADALARLAASGRREEILRFAWQALLDEGVMLRGDQPIEGWTIGVAPGAIELTKGDTRTGRPRADPGAADGALQALADQLALLLNIIEHPGEVFPRQP
jgi:hypothetical protein